MRRWLARKAKCYDLENPDYNSRLRPSFHGFLQSVDKPGSGSRFGFLAPGRHELSGGFSPGSDFGKEPPMLCFPGEEAGFLPLNRH